MSYLKVWKSVKDAVLDVHVTPKGDVFVSFGEVDLFGEPDELITALDKALTDVQAVMDARED